MSAVHLSQLTNKWSKYTIPFSIFFFTLQYRNHWAQSFFSLQFLKKEMKWGLSSVQHCSSTHLVLFCLLLFWNNYSKPYLQFAGNAWITSFLQTTQTNACLSLLSKGSEFILEQTLWLGVSFLSWQGLGWREEKSFDSFWLGLLPGATVVLITFH